MSSPTPTTYGALAQRQSSLIRKALEGSVFMAPMSASLPTSLTTGSSSALATLPASWYDIGWCDKGTGHSWSRAIDTSNVESMGANDSTRTDITKDTTKLKFMAQETKRKTLELYHQVDLSSVTPDATTGEVQFAQPIRTNVQYFRALALFVDGSGADTIYIGRLLPRAIVTDLDDQKATNDGDDPWGYGVSIQGKYDAVAGYSMRHLFGGPGWKNLLTSMGFSS